MFSLFNKKTKAPGFVAINPQAQHIAFAYMQPQNGQYQLAACKAEQTTDLQNFLAPLLAKHQLAGVDCSLVLAPQDYQLLLLDPLKVPAAELRAAVKWRIKDMIDFPIEQAAVDAFFVPSYQSDNPKKMYVTVAHLSRLQSLLASLQALDLTVTSIDITELALRNLIYAHVNTDSSVAFILPQEGEVKLIISSAKNLYLVRTIEMAVTTEQFEALLLELQRTFDYCQSELNLPVPKKLLLAPSFSEQTALIEYLSQQLASEVTLLDVQPTAALAAIGGAMRIMESEVCDATN